MKRDGRATRVCARLAIVALALGIVLELIHVIEEARAGFRPADWICRGAPPRAASVRVDTGVAGGAPVAPTFMKRL